MKNPKYFWVLIMLTAALCAPLEVLAAAPVAEVYAFPDCTMLAAVLRNEAELFSVKHDRFMTLDELWSLGGDQGPYYTEKAHGRFTVVDMDRDTSDVPEIVLDLGDKVVLHLDGGVVYAHTFDVRAMQNIRKDGSYQGSDGASSGSYCRVKKFDEKSYEEETFAEYDATEGYERYEINGKRLSSQKEFDRKIAGLIDKDYAVWSGFTDENIAARVQSYPNGEAVSDFLSRLGVTKVTRAEKQNEFGVALLVVPLQKRSSVEVCKTKFNEETFEVSPKLDELLVRGEQDRALLFRCPISEVIPERAVVVYTREGEADWKGHFWFPSFSGDDGSLITNEEFVPLKTGGR